MDSRLGKIYLRQTPRERETNGMQSSQWGKPANPEVRMGTAQGAGSRGKRSLPIVGFLVCNAFLLSGCGLVHRHRARAAKLAAQMNPGQQPDKVLFERSENEIEHGRYDVGRLTLQTLLNTYPDSEYLAKAKLAIADSYYREGGVSGLTQAEAEYKDFITFFPTAPEAPEAQFRTGMAHFRLMGKADRDRTEAKLCEMEFKEFLLKYPDSPLMPRVKGRLRETQEVLAQGDYEIAQFYFTKGAYLAAKSRFQEIADHYPDFSQGDKVLWSLAQSFERLKIPNQAVPYYGRIITEHPFSPLVNGSKKRLNALHQRIPNPTRATLARARADELVRPHHNVFERVGGMMSSAPDVSATRHGPVHLGPQPAEAEEAKTLSPAAPMGTIAVETVNDLDPPKAEDPKPASPPLVAQTSPQPQENKTANAQESSNMPDSNASSDASTTTKKKGRFGLFKKLVKPF